MNSPTAARAVSAAAPTPAFFKYHLLFFAAGFPALIYQIVWQRALFTIYGVNIESVTVIVTVFMLGLGLGSLAGGWLSKRPDLPLLGIFGSIELGIGAFGIISLRVFHAVATSTAGVGALETGLVTFALLLLPTLLMGSTLPLLVAHLVRRNGNVGESVGSLYASNTAGSAVACFLAAYFILRVSGESGSVTIAAIMNGCVAITALFLQLGTQNERDLVTNEPIPAQTSTPRTIPFVAGLVACAAVGFLALGYEMIWYRVYSFASARSASCFAQLLGFYLAGIALGSLAVRDACHGKLRDDLAALLRAGGIIIFWGSIVAFLVAPGLALLATYAPMISGLPLVLIAAAFLGAAFPMISHAAINPAAAGAGSKLSFLYLSNIIGSACGSYMVGFVAMDRFSTTGISLALLSIGLALGGGVLLVSGWRFTVRRCAGLVAAIALVCCSWPLYSSLYERLLYKGEYRPGTRFSNLVENRSGVVAISADRRVFGGGVYDGYVNTDLVNDLNGIYRAFAVDAIHPAPKEVLMIGLSLGSWSQVIASNPQVERLTIVEINPGYLTLIPQFVPVASLVRNPKVEIVIDDGRRWLIRNSSRRFDMIIMNTTFNWVAHTSNLLSEEFLRLVRPHLKTGGILYYNTTSSSEALLTGATVFPNALRVGNFLAVSDSPITFDKERWRVALTRYTIDGARILNLGNQADRTVLERTLAIADTLNDRDPGKIWRIESTDSLRKRLRGARLITDDNMGTEWGSASK